MTTPEQKQIGEIIENYRAALLSKDAEAAIAHHDERVLCFSMAPPLNERGSDTSSLKAWFATWRSGIEIEFQELEISASDSIAFATSLNRMRGEKQDGEQIDLWYRSTVGFVNSGAQWTISHMHESVPFYMDGSLQAAIDLAPGSTADINTSARRQ